MAPKIKIIAIGELLWDCFADDCRLGGAPANVACLCAQYGADVTLVSAVGEDELGRAALAQLVDKKLAINNIQISSYPTGQVSVNVSTFGIPSYRIEENVAWDHIHLPSFFAGQVGEAHGICFGSLAQRGTESRRTIREALRLCPDSCLKVFDVNLRLHYYDREIIVESLQLANVLKLNHEEMPVLTEMFALTGDEKNQLRELMLRFDLQCIALTRGSAGSLIMSETAVSERPCTPVGQIADTVGAGDAFTAALLIGLIKRRDIDEINLQASQTAAYVCTQTGATPALPADLTASWRS